MHMSLDKGINKIMMEDRDTISNEVDEIHKRIDKQVEECFYCMKNIYRLDTEIEDIKDCLKPITHRTRMIYFLSGVCAIQAAVYLLPIVKKLVKK